MVAEHKRHDETVDAASVARKKPSEFPPIEFRRIVGRTISGIRRHSYLQPKVL
jgi:hypothetical protein